MKQHAKRNEALDIYRRNVEQLDENEIEPEDETRKFEVDKLILEKKSDMCNDYSDIWICYNCNR